MSVRAWRWAVVIGLTLDGLIIGALLAAIAR